MTGVVFQEEQPSFLVGYIAGKMTKTNKVGFVGGIKFPLIERFEYGYMAGVKMANPTCEVLSQYAESISGGNQQKVIIAREVSNDPEVLIASQPTRGLDVGAIILLVAGFNPLEA